MGWMTAAIWVGHAHQNHGGINPSHHLLLSENSQPSWILQAMGAAEPGTIWVPTRECMLEDGLLMAGLLVAEDPELIKLAKAFRCDYRKRADLTEDIDPKVLVAMRARCREVAPHLFLSITLFAGSTTLNTIKAIGGYAMGVEVSLPVYTRFDNAWARCVETRGILPGRWYWPEKPSAANAKPAAGGRKARAVPSAAKNLKSEVKAKSPGSAKSVGSTKPAKSAKATKTKK